MPTMKPSSKAFANTDLSRARSYKRGQSFQFGPAARRQNTLQRRGSQYLAVRPTCPCESCALYLAGLSKCK